MKLYALVAARRWTQRSAMCNLNAWPAKPTNLCGNSIQSQYVLGRIKKREKLHLGSVSSVSILSVACVASVPSLLSCITVA